MSISNEIRKQQANNQAFIHSVITKANQDSSFKDRLLADPERTLKEFNPKFKLASGAELIVEDQPSLNTVYVDVALSEDIELTEEQLETVAGGTSVIVIGCLISWAAE